MLRLLSDENFNGEIVRGLFRANPTIDLVRVQDVGLLAADDFGIGGGKRSSVAHARQRHDARICPRSRKCRTADARACSLSMIVRQLASRSKIFCCSHFTAKRASGKVRYCTSDFYESMMCMNRLNNINSPNITVMMMSERVLLAAGKSQA